MAVTPTIEIPQIVKMRLGVDYRGVISCRDFQLSIRPLSMAETVQLASEVAEELSKAPAVFRTTLSEHSLLAKKTLVLASTSDVGAGDPQLTDYVLDRMTPDELQFLYKQYVDVCNRANPSLETLTDKELDEILFEVKKNPSLRTELSRSQLLSLAAYFLTNAA